ncbi:MAG: helix-turn-helix transcriptional regulator, partial [Anaerobutyricum sp.]|nr:helix-turn-helix transcriptional regulator [Anaerobutyricum sp.]
MGFPPTWLHTLSWAHNWELGETAPNPEQLILLSKQFDISIDELVGNDAMSSGSS